MKRYLVWGLMCLGVGCGGPKYALMHPSAQSETFHIKDNDTNLQIARSEINKKDTTPPRIILNNKQRGVEKELVIDAYTLNGQVIDDSRIAFVRVNGKRTTVDQQGYFSAQVKNNIVNVTAADIYNNVAHKSISLAGKKVYAAPRMHFSAAGKYYALVIGINRYQYLTKLDTAVNDAQAVAQLLKEQYGFSITMLLNEQATRNNIMSTFNQLNKKVNQNDHLLIYYSGHGYYDKEGDTAYWLPANAKNDEDTKWIHAGSITTHLKRNRAKNILVVADSCYSGTLTRRSSRIKLGAMQNERRRYLEKMLTKKSRVLIASGGNEPVLDSGGQGHSIFAQVFLNGLRDMEQSAFTAEEFFIKQSIQERVAGKVSQTPEFQVIRESGHDSGDFVFQRR